MIRKIWKTGPTLVISIPQDTARMKNLEEGDLIEIKITEHIKEKSNKKDKYEIEELT